MQLKNLASGLSLALSDDLLWSDEHAWSPALSTVSYLVTGALLIQSGVRQSGRAITLVGPIDMAWTTRAVIDTLYDWAAEPVAAASGRFELSLTGGRVFTVAFRHAEVPIEAEPVTGLAARADSDFYRLTVRLMEIG